MIKTNLQNQKKNKALNKISSITSKFKGFKNKIPIIGKPKDKKEQPKTIELKSEPIKEEAPKISLDKIIKENVQMGQ